MKKLFLIILTLVIQLNLSAQDTYGIKIPNAAEYEHARFCGPLTKLFNNKPKEVAFSINQDHKKNLYFQFNNREWFENLFNDPYDGVAIDIITKDSFDCDLAVLPDQVRGEVLKPVYANNFKKNIETVQKGFYQVLIGKLPIKYHHKEVEFNILMLSKRYLCQYRSTYNLQSYNYDLLDMGLYLDSLVYKNKKIKFDTIQGFETSHKVLKFIVPFEKNKTTFSALDIKPLYDSLRLTDFNIKSINIKAYASIEGSAERNQQLQNQRSKSIIEALQTFQRPSISTTVTTAENWVEFLNDIKGTKYEHLKSFTKSEIKEQVANKEGQEFENILKNHRKALITLYLAKIDQYTEFTENDLLGKFNNAIAIENLNEASKIQNTLFERMKSKEVDPGLLYEMKIPRQKKFVDIFNANSAFRYQFDSNNLLTSYYEFEKLNELDPDNHEVIYNLLALKLRMQHAFKSMPKKEKLLNKINSLNDLGIEPNLVKRMLVNYHILNAELLMRNGLYQEKDISVKFILDNYMDIPLSDYDYLSLAQYITYFYDRETAIELLKDKVNKIDSDKKLLFYYLNLTLIDDSIVENPEYRTIMLNAINMDKQRFCKLFDSSEKGGVTFQLLKNKYLRKTYCENCLD